MVSIIIHNISSIRHLASYSTSLFPSPFHHIQIALHQNQVSMVPIIESTTSKNSFIFLPIPRDSRLTDGVLNGSSCSEPVIFASDLRLDGLLLGIFALTSERRVENAETDINVSLGGSSIPRRATGRGSGVGFWDRTRASWRVPLSGRWNEFDGTDIL